MEQFAARLSLEMSSNDVKKTNRTAIQKVAAWGRGAAASDARAVWEKTVKLFERMSTK